MSSSTIHFCVRCDSTHWGETVGVLGSFNQWNKSSFVSLTTDENSYPKWSASVKVDLNLKEIEYKYVIVKDHHIVRWETNSTHNRRLKLSQPQSNSTNKVSDAFGQVHAPNSHPVSHDLHYFKSTNNHAVYNASPSLDALEKELVEITNKHKSWRQRLQFIRQLFTDADVQKLTNFDPNSPSLAHLTTIAVYLQFLSTGYIPCAEDGGHHRPNHHAHEAQILDMKLAALTRDADDSFVSFVTRKILPYLPSYSSQFMVSVPLTRIRDIAHRNDLPKDLKLDIKHNLQNKLHRCAGPEDLQTSQRILDQISHGGYSQPFVDQFHIFHDELKQFFNRASVDERLEFLSHVGVKSAGDLLRMKRDNYNAFDQLEQIVKVRMELVRVAFMSASDSPPEGDIQKMRLADIELESYTFLLLAALAKETEEQDAGDIEKVIHTISLAMHSINFNGIQRNETQCIFDELDSIVDGEIELIRLHAALERCVRFVTTFADTIFNTFDARARSIGSSFHLEQRIVDVFAESEIRASIVFQTSRLVTSLSTKVKRELHLPLWNALCTGMIVADNVEYVQTLSDAKVSKRSVIVCEECDGEEEVDENIVGVITAVPIPQLSHLGVRVRQAGVVFVCAEQRSSFVDSVWKLSRRIDGKCMLKVNDAEGLAEFRRYDQAIDAKIDIVEQDTTAALNAGKLSTLSMSIDEDVDDIISDIRDATKETVSAKAYVAGNLLRIADESNGLFKACDGAAIPHGKFQREIDRNKVGYRKLVFAYHESRNDDNLRKIQELIHARFEVSSDDVQALQSVLHGRRVMVRSSANAEDIEKLSGAGLYDTVANVDVDDIDMLADAIKTVWASVWTERAAASRLRYDVKDNVVSMAVLIQRMIRADLSFVAFSRDPVQSKSDSVYIELVCGMGETLASAAGGSGSPFRFRVDRSSLKVIPVALASYSYALVPSEQTGGLVQSPVNYSNVRMTTDKEWRNDIVKRIAKTVLLLEKELGAEQDVEGCMIVHEDELYVVQARPQIL